MILEVEKKRTHVGVLTKPVIPGGAGVKSNTSLVSWAGLVL